MSVIACLKFEFFYIEFSMGDSRSNNICRKYIEISNEAKSMYFITSEWGIHAVFSKKKQLFSVTFFGELIKN